MFGVYSRVYCEENVIVDFFLARCSTKSMEVFIYHPKDVTDNCFDEADSLIGYAIVHNNMFTFEHFIDNIVQYHYYQIGLECIKRIQHYPEAILG